MAATSSRIYRRCVSTHCNNSSSTNNSGSSLNDRDDRANFIDELSWADVSASPANRRLNDELFRQQSSPLLWQPKYLMTRRTAKVAREVQNIWNTRLGRSTRIVTADKIKLLFNDMKLFPSTSQINEMLQSAKQCASRSSSSYLTLSEFCIFATELKRSSHNRIYRKDYFSRLLEKNGYEKKIRDKALATKAATALEREHFPKHDVFLGGSCNPTTWRQDEAIPLFKKYGVSFYNPQVSEWKEELIEMEHRAKENATVLFYVIDNQTRNVVSSIEVSYFAGSKRNIIPVVFPYDGPGQCVASERLSEEEFEELKNSICVLKKLLERRGIRLFDNIADAVKYTIKILKENYESESAVRVNYKILKIKEAFEAIDKERNGHINADDVSRAIQLLTQHRKVYPTVRLKKSTNRKTGIDKKRNETDGKINFEQFCKIISELKLCDEECLSDDTTEGRTNCSHFFRSLSTPYEYSASNGFQVPIDIYLGGDCEKEFDWRNKIAIPLIRKACVTFFNPESERNGGHMISSMEFSIIDNCSVLLFVIPNTSRSLIAMSLASFHISAGSNIVLCVQPLTENSILGSDKLSQSAVNDYNRGRLYLEDVAKRENVSVCDTIASAVEIAIQKCLLR